MARLEAVVLVGAAREYATFGFIAPTRAMPAGQETKRGARYSDCGAWSARAWGVETSGSMDLIYRERSGAPQQRAAPAVVPPRWRTVCRGTVLFSTCRVRSAALLECTVYLRTVGHLVVCFQVCSEVFAARPPLLFTASKGRRGLSTETRTICTQKGIFGESVWYLRI